MYFISSFIYGASKSFEYDVDRGVGCLFFTTGEAIAVVGDFFVNSIASKKECVGKKRGKIHTERMFVVVGILFGSRTHLSFQNLVQALPCAANAVFESAF